MIGASATFLQALERVRRVGPYGVPVLILGETGTGKELFAEELHRCSGRPGPLVAVNCAGLSAAIMDSQLFGHETGAFTGANRPALGLWRAAEGGTLFLDEVGELPVELQPKLLRALETGKILPVGAVREVAVDVRIVSATHQPLLNWVEQGRFRRDLWARLACYQLRLPALRERGRDVVLLAQHILQTSPICKGMRLTPAAEAAMLASVWPENIRGLRAWLETLAIDGVTDVLACHVPTETLERPTPVMTAPTPDASSVACGIPDAVIEALVRLKTASRADLERALSLSPRSLQYVMPRLVAEGRVQRLGASRSQVYSLKLAS